MRYLAVLLLVLSLGFLGGCGASLTRSNGFGAPRSSIKGNPLVERIQAARKAKGLKAALLEAREHTFVAAFPGGSPAKMKGCYGNGALSTAGPGGKLIVIPASPHTEATSRLNNPLQGERLSEAQAHAVHGVCQALGFESAFRVTTGPLGRPIRGMNLCQARTSRRSRTFTHVGETSPLEGAVRVSPLPAVPGVTPKGSRTFFRPFVLPGLGDEPEVIVADSSCKQTDEGRFACSLPDFTTSKKVSKLETNNYRVIQFLECSNRSPGSQAALRDIRDAVITAKHGAHFDALMKKVKRKGSYYSIRALERLLARVPRGTKANQARALLMRRHLYGATRVRKFQGFNEYCVAAAVRNGTIDRTKKPRKPPKRVNRRRRRWRSNTRKPRTELQNLNRTIRRCREGYDKLHTYCSKRKMAMKVDGTFKAECVAWMNGRTEFGETLQRSKAQQTATKAFVQFTKKGFAVCGTPAEIQQRRVDVCERWKYKLARTQAEYRSKRNSTAQLNRARARAGYGGFRYNWSSFTNYISRLQSVIAEKCTLFGVGGALKGKLVQKKWRGLYAKSLKRCDAVVTPAWQQKATALATHEQLQVRLKQFIANLPAYRTALKKAAK